MIDGAPAAPPSASATGWRPTIAHVRGCAAAVVLAVIAVLARRPDLLVLAAPFAIITGWSVAVRPSRAPVFESRLADTTIREGQATTWQAALRDAPGLEAVVAVLPPSPWLSMRPSGGVVGSAAVGSAAGVSIAIRSTRWGHHRVERVTVNATSAWAAFRWNHRTNHATLISLPLPATFDSAATIRRSNGLVGLDRSARPGDGSEFAGIRAFQSGDRMRRINWARSLRVGTLQVTSTWADQDTHVVLEVDATEDLGASEGIDGLASSLDAGVRAAGAIAEHHLSRGDRVSVRVFGSSPSRAVAAATGRAHLRRILDTLAVIRAGTDPRGLAGLGRLTTPAEALVIMLSPLVSPAALERAVSLARRGLNVVVVDTMPAGVVDDADELTALAWRIRLLERRREIRIVQEVGVPVVRWDGPGSLDPFLRDIARRASAPRMANR